MNREGRSFWPSRSFGSPFTIPGSPVRHKFSKAIFSPSWYFTSVSFWFIPTKQIQYPGSRPENHILKPFSSWYFYFLYYPRWFRILTHFLIFFFYFFWVNLISKVVFHLFLMDKSLKFPVWNHNQGLAEEENTFNCISLAKPQHQPPEKKEE